MEVAAGKATYELQAQLPRLPIPRLEHTLAKLRASCAPFADDAAALGALFDDYAGGTGLLAQQHLERVVEAREPRNYTEKLWDETAYLAYKAPLPLHTAAWVAIKAPPRAATTQAERAARLSLGLLRFYEELDAEVEPFPSPVVQANRQCSVWRPMCSAAGRCACCCTRPSSAAYASRAPATSLMWCACTSARRRTWWSCVVGACFAWASTRWFSCLVPLARTADSPSGSRILRHFLRHSATSWQRAAASLP